MASKTLVIKELIRTPQYGPEDKLEFTNGVNLIVGPGNSGKTKWLNMLDYLLGDSGKTEDAFPSELVEKFDTVGARFIIDNEEFFVERRWKEKGTRGKVFVEGDEIPAHEFQQFLLERLNIPIVHFPKGNPYEERAWPELSWRIILRHIYRQQRFWGDIADKQPEVEQHASLMQFLGIAEFLFSGKSGELVSKRKELWKLQGAKEQYLKLLDQISKDVADEKEIQIAVTSESVNQAINRLRKESENLQIRRENLLLQLKGQGKRDEQKPEIDIDQLSNEWASLRAGLSESQFQLNRFETRLVELDKYKQSIIDEIARLERTRKAGEVLVDLKVTQCPVCDQPVDTKRGNSDHCYLCGHSLEKQGGSGIERIDAEVKRLEDEKQEALELINRLSLDRDKLLRSNRTIVETIQRLESRLTPVRQASASILPPEIGLIDMEKGRIQERIRQLERIMSALEYQRHLSTQIDDLNTQVGVLEAAVKIEAKKVQYAYAGDLLAEGMNSYANAIQASGRQVWLHNRINVSLNEKSFNFTIDGGDWNIKLGGTSILYFLLSYHYGLLSLTNKEDCHYPGLLILDLPATFMDGSSIRDKENFIAEPFIQLTNKPEMNNTQVIITGSAFDGLDNVNRINLEKIWV